MAANKVIPIVRADGEGERLWFYGGGVHLWKATAAQTGGSFLLFEGIMSRGKTTPLHTHPEVDESLYVLDGDLLLHIDGEELRLGPGDFAMAPRGVPHAFFVSSETARILFLETPGSSEAFYRGASEPATADLELAAPVDLARIRASAERHGGIEILGPPPFAQAQH